MRFMILIYGSNAAWSQLDQPIIDRIDAEHKALQAELSASGELIGHDELALADAVILRRRSGSVVTDNGPVSAGGAVAAGFYILDCANKLRAIEIAGRFVEAEFAQIEVRRLTGTTVLDIGAPGAYEGIKNKWELIASVNDDKESAGRVPTGWIEALDVFEKSDVVRAHVSSVLHETFLAIKRSEVAKYNAIIPATELTWMTRRF
jgi:hypothetical protein